MECNITYAKNTFFELAEDERKKSYYTHKKSLMPKRYFYEDIFDLRVATELDISDPWSTEGSNLSKAN